MLPVWLNFVDVAKVKAFVEITVAESYRSGAQSLIMTTGLGGMKPNTLAVGESLMTGSTCHCHCHTCHGVSLSLLSSVLSPGTLC